MLHDMRHRLAYITSLRELAGDEQVGRIVVDPLSGVVHGYRAGCLERLVARLADPGDALARTFELAAVVVDDDDDELVALGRDAPPWPDDLIPLGLFLRVPSTWRRLTPAARETPESLRARKRAAKTRYEMRLRRLLEDRGVDLVLSDSYMALFGDVLLDAFRGRILNAHPGVLAPGHPAHTPGGTPTRDTWTRAVHGFVIVDDKRATPGPDGPTRVVEFEGERRVAVAVPRAAISGVSVHVVTEGVDAGRVIAKEWWSFDPARMTPELIRHRNYEVKHRVIARGLLAWAGLRRAQIEDEQRETAAFEG